MTTKSPQPPIPPPLNPPPATFQPAPVNLTVHPMPNFRHLSRRMRLRFALLNSPIPSPLAKPRRSFCAEFSPVPTALTHAHSLRFPLIKPTAQPWPHPVQPRRSELPPVVCEKSPRLCYACLRGFAAQCKQQYSTNVRGQNSPITRQVSTQFLPILIGTTNY